MKLWIACISLFIVSPMAQAKLARVPQSKDPLILEGFVLSTNSKTVTFQEKTQQHKLKKSSVVQANPMVFKSKQFKKRYVKIKVKPNDIVSTKVKRANWSR